MAVEGPPEPVDAANVEAPAPVPDAPAPTPELAAEAAAPTPEAVAPVTAEAVDVSKKGQRKIDRIQDKSGMDRADKRTKLDEMDRAILDLQTQISKEKDTGKQARLRDKLAEKVDERKQAHAEYKEMIKSFDAKIAEIQTLKSEIDALKEVIQANESTHDAEKIRELADQTRTLDDKEKALKKLIPGGNLGDVEATLEAYQEERKDIRFEEARREKIGEADRVARLEQAEREQADKDLEARLAEIFGGTPPAEVAKSEEVAAKPGEDPLTKEENEVILDNKIDQIAFDLAKLLATNVPTKDDTFGRYGFEAKRGLLIVLSYFGEDAGWANQLSADEQKALAMTVSSTAGADGKPVTSIKWEKLEFSLTKVQKVYEMAFGKEGWAKEMEGLTPTTKLSDLQARVDEFPDGTQDKNELAMIKFVDTLTDLGAKPDSGVQSFITINADKIIKAYDPNSEQAEFNIDNVVKIIGDNKFHKKTSLKDVMAAVDPKSFAEAPLNAKEISAKAKAVVASFTSEDALIAYQSGLEEAALVVVKVGLPDISGSLKDAFAKALGELKGGLLTDPTKELLEKEIGTQMTLIQEYPNTSYYDILKKQRETAVGQDLADVEKVMDALGRNAVSEASEK